MSRVLQLILFDVDGTLVDSQGHIMAAMTRAFEGEGLEVPPRAMVLGIVGLSLDHAIARLAGAQSAPVQHALVAGYKQAYQDLRRQSGTAESSPLYAGTREMLAGLARQPDVLLGVATGKSARGLDHLIAGHDLGAFLVTRQCADHHPSKPHPSMILRAMSETGVAEENTVMVGDTSFDRDMAQAAGVRFVAVSWGYHGLDQLAGADAVIDNWAELKLALVAMGKAAA